jgi:hypothetical protein
MKSLTIRIDKDFEQLLRKKAEQRNIKFTRYLRSLIDKGLTTEACLEEQGARVLHAKANEGLEIRMVEMIAEILIHTRTLLEVNPLLSDKVKGVLVDAERRSKSYVGKLIDAKTEL